MRAGLPAALPGMRVGLLGGSFDPPHAGHVHITLEALKRCSLDRVWWLVTPGNPLKAGASAPLELRLAAARRICRHPSTRATAVEARFGTRFTADTLKELFRLFPQVEFVWLMGADNLAELHRWKNWRWIMSNARTAVLPRPRQHLRAAGSVAARSFRRCRIPSTRSATLMSRSPPCWTMLPGPTVRTSSTEIRNRSQQLVSESLSLHVDRLGHEQY